MSPKLKGEIKDDSKKSIRGTQRTTPGGGGGG
jgi:hypothetical protein